MCRFYYPWQILGGVLACGASVEFATSGEILPLLNFWWQVSKVSISRMIAGAVCCQVSILESGSADDLASSLPF